jgi:GxxExxY protein
VSVRYDEQKLELGFRLVILVENEAITEIKSMEHFADVHHKQVLTYLKLTNLK